MKKLFSIVLILALCLTLFVGCADTETNPEVSKATEVVAAATDGVKVPSGEKIKIGIAAKGFSDPFTAMEANMYAKVADENFADTVEYTMLDCEFDTSKQCGVIENFISMGVDAIICQVADPEAVLPYMDQLQELGIPFICDVAINHEWPYLISSEPAQEGEALGNYTLQYIQEKNIEDPFICFMQGEVGNYHANGREDNAKKVLEAAGYSVAVTDTANWRRDEAIQLMENWCQLYDHIDVVICANDDMSLGVVQVLEAEGRLADTMVCSVDALAEAVQSITDGKLNMTVGKDIVYGCTTALQLCVDLVNGVDRSADKVIVCTKDTISASNPDALAKWQELHGVK